jgi:PAS domain S-box-containing protein
LGQQPGWWVDALARFVRATPVRLVVLRQDVADDPVVEWANEPGAAVIDRTPDAVVGQRLRELYPPAAADDVIGRLQLARDEGQAWYEVVRDLPGGRLTARIQILALDDDRFLSIAYDTSGEREAERRLAQVTEAVSVGIYQWNVRDDRVEWSDGLFDLLGYATGEVEPSVERFLEHVHPDDRPQVEEVADQARRDLPFADVAYRIVRTDGAVRHVEARAQHAFGGDAQLLYVLGVVIDTTDQVELQRHQEAARRTADRQRTALQVHDRIVQGLSTAWLALQLGEQDQAMRALEESTEQAQHLVTELLADVAADGGIEPGDLRHARGEGAS